MSRTVNVATSTARCRTGRSGCVAAACVLGLVLSVASRVARAEAVNPQDRATARQLALEGYEALHAGEYAVAVDRLQRADQLVHAPTIKLDLARSHVGLGHLVEAHELYQQILREGVAPGSPPSWQKAVASARQEVVQLEPRLAWLNVRVEGPRKPRVKLDGTELPAASLGAKRAVDPGKMELSAEADGFLPLRQTVQVGEGESRDVRLVLLPDPARPPERALKPATTPAPADRAPSHVGGAAAYTAYGVGAAGLLLGGTSSVLMFAARRELEGECVHGHCPESAAHDLARYHTYGTLTAVGLAVGIAGAGVGTYLLLSHKSGADSAPGYDVSLNISPGRVSVDGRF